ncbi:MAG: hypothetical protein KAJ49_02605 [Arcobacteraceae bacterium]|nr:hypothetical protein [Arcobacteraceae bacterium]
MKNKYKQVILLLIFSSYSYASGNLSISIETAIKFNTICAKCHEGECSGRLSFDDNPKIAFSHINRYIPNSSKTQAKELFTILKHMKKQCVIFFPNIYLNNKTSWFEKELIQYSLSSRKSYFIPLGLLEKGIYKLKINTNKLQLYTIMIISKNFEIVLDEYSTSCKNVNNLSYIVNDSKEYYLRIESRNKLIIKSINNSIGK